MFASLYGEMRITCLYELLHDRRDSHRKTDHGCSDILGNLWRTWSSGCQFCLVCVPYLGEYFRVVVVRNLEFPGQRVCRVEMRKTYGLDDSPRSFGWVTGLGMMEPIRFQVKQGTENVRGKYQIRQTLGCTPSLRAIKINEASTHLRRSQAAS